MQPAPALSSRWRFGATVLALLLVVATFLRAHPYTNSKAFGGFGVSQLATLCIRDHYDPYDPGDLSFESQRLTNPREAFYPDNVGSPPGALLLVFPFAWLTWPAAGWAYEALSCSFLLCALSALLLRVAVQRSLAAAAVLAAALLSRTFSHAMYAGNHALLTVSCLVLACFLLQETRLPSFQTPGLPLAQRSLRTRRLLGALLLGIALALKPQVAVGVAAFLVLHPRSRVPALRGWLICLLLTLAGTAVIAWRMGSLRFIHSLLYWTSAALKDGNQLDPSPANGVSYTFLQLQALFLQHSGTSVDLANLLTASLMLLLLFTGFRLSIWQRSILILPWTSLALLVILSLLPVYHRHYDRMLVLLLIPAAMELERFFPRVRWLLPAITACWMLWDTVADHLLGERVILALNPIFELALCLLLLSLLAQNRLAPLDRRELHNPTLAPAET